MHLNTAFLEPLQEILYSLEVVVRINLFGVKGPEGSMIGSFRAILSCGHSSMWWFRNFLGTKGHSMQQPQAHHAFAKGIAVKLGPCRKKLAEELRLVNASRLKLDPCCGMLLFHQLLKRHAEELRHLDEEGIAHDGVL